MLTSHKGVDLHAASALLVMKDRLEGGHRLVNLFRSEIHTFWGENAPGGMEKLLNTGRYFNPNKHHYGHFIKDDAGGEWFNCTDCRGRMVNTDWPGNMQGTDLEMSNQKSSLLYNNLLGGLPAGDHCAVDVISFPLGQDGPVLSGVLWRLIISGDSATAMEVGQNLAVARGRKQGLLINPHMEAWLLAGTERG